jgi:hypothetical protein
VACFKLSAKNSPGGTKEDLRIDGPWLKFEQLAKQIPFHRIIL